MPEGQQWIKKLYNIDTWSQYYKTFYVCNLQMFVINFGVVFDTRKPFQLGIMFVSKTRGLL